MSNQPWHHPARTAPSGFHRAEVFRRSPIQVPGSPGPRPAHRLGIAARLLVMAIALATALLGPVFSGRAAEPAPPQPAFQKTISLSPGGFEDIAAGDLNGDGYLDLLGVTGIYGGSNIVFSSDGQGGLSASDKPLGRTQMNNLALGDLDRDGNLDIVATTSDGRLLLLRNNGGGSFTLKGRYPVSPPVAGGQSSPEPGKPALGDLNGDGYLDVVVAHTNTVLLNDQAGGFDAPQGFHCDGAASDALALGDLNGDGYLDIVTLNPDRDLVYFGDGRGRFDFSLPFGFSGYTKSSISLVDFNGDQKLDVVTNYGSIFLNRLEAIPATSGACQSGATSEATGELVNDSLHRFISGVSVAAGDLNGDGLPDLAVARSNKQNLVYLNQVGSATRWQTPTIWFGTGSDRTLQVLLADVNADGSLDLVTTDDRRLDAVYLNDGNGSQQDAQLLDPPARAAALANPKEQGLIRALALSDLNGDGRQDIIAGRSEAPDRLGEIYLSRPDGSFTSRSFGSPGQLNALLLADLNNDQRPELIAGLGDRQNEIFTNLGGGNFSLQPVAFGVLNTGTTSLAAGDFNKDGFLDLATGSEGFKESRVYFNDGRGGFPEGASLGGDVSSSRATGIAAGDLNGDGSLDIVLSRARGGEDGAQNYLFLNDGQGNFNWPGSDRPFGNGKDTTMTVALGDMNGDGTLDIVSANAWVYRQNAVYLNDGQANFDWPGAEQTFGTGTDNTNGLALGDVDGDGDLDIAVSNERWKLLTCRFCQDPSASDAFFSGVYLNDGQGHFESLHSLGDGFSDVRSIALGDVDGDGDPDMVTGQSDPQAQTGGTVSNPTIRSSPLLPSGGSAPEDETPYQPGRVAVWPNNLQSASGQPNQPPAIRLLEPLMSVQGGLVSPAQTEERPVIPIVYQLSDPQGEPAGLVRACFSLDGGDHWRLALQSGQTRPAGAELVQPAGGCPYLADESLGGTLPASRSGTRYTFNWDTYASGFFGQSDRVIFRMEVYPSSGGQAHQTAASGQRSFASSASQPFPARGTLVQVLEGSQPVSGAQVYRLMGGEQLGELLGETDPGGFLKGRGEINTGDALVALAPVEDNAHYTLYHTNAKPNPTGLSAYTVVSAGLQELRVSADQPLLLFKLYVSLEWDARNDGSFLSDLKSAIERSSELLFDVSDGRMALGPVQIDQAGENWLTADAVIFASNGIRPRASMGGVVDGPTDDRSPDGQPILNAYQPGQIRMGPNWDPFGENRSDLGEAWWQALAHEFGHYFLYLPDNYLGFDPRGFITHTDCFGSFMTTAYNDSYSEFLTDSEWRDPNNNCQDAIANYLTGRSDWATITRFYNQIPPVFSPNPGPSHLPLDVTRVTINDPRTDRGPIAGGDRAAITTRNIDLRGADGKRQTLPNGQAYLIKTQNTASTDDDAVIALGSSGNRDFIKLRGANPGDRLCILDTSREQVLTGCLDPLTDSSLPLDVGPAPGWRPDIQVQAIAEPTLLLTVTRPLAGQPPAIQLLSAYVPTPTITVTRAAAPGLPGELSVSQPAMTISYQYPVTETLPYRLLVLEPSMVVTVTQDDPGGTLYAQILPAYDPPAGLPVSVRSPSAELTPVEGRPGVYRQVIPLQYPFFNGFTRVWVEPEAPAAQKTGVHQVGLPEAISQFFLSPNWPVDLRGGGGADLRGGGGVDLRGGGGVDIRGGGGADLRGGGGVDIRGGGGVDLRAGGGVDLRAGGGVDMRGGGGVDIRGGGGADIRGGGGVPVRSWGANQRSLGAPVASADGQVTIFNTRDLFGETSTTSLEALVRIKGLPGWLTPVGQAYRFISGRDIERTIAFNYLQRDVPDGYEYTLKIYYSPDGLAGLVGAAGHDPGPGRKPGGRAGADLRPVRAGGHGRPGAARDRLAVVLLPDAGCPPGGRGPGIDRRPLYHHVQLRRPERRPLESVLPGGRSLGQQP